MQVVGDDQKAAMARQRLGDLLEAKRDQAGGGGDGGVYRTYSTYSRGLDLLIGAYNLLDLVPRGRDEDAEAPMKWVRLHDQYAHAPAGG